MARSRCRCWSSRSTPGRARSASPHAQSARGATGGGLCGGGCRPLLPYRYRPDYPAALFQHLSELCPQRQAALDLGCGTGKVARGLARRFATVTGVDLSAEMLAVARRHSESASHRIRWICGPAETTPLGDTHFDLFVAAASIHWMNHDRLFPRLAATATDDHVFAVVDGDEPFEPPWQSDWQAFLHQWIPELTGAIYEPNNASSAFATKMTRHRRWLAMDAETTFEHSVTQTVDDFVACQYSRDTFAPARLGDRRTAFAAGLRELLAPHADGEDKLGFRVRTEVCWGQIRVA